MKLKDRLWNKLIAIIVLINYSLLLFDLTYLPARSFYGQSLPLLIQLYDPVKAIAPHWQTQNYLALVDEAATKIEQTGLSSPSSVDILKELQISSVRLIDDKPFQGDRSRILDKIANEVRMRVVEDSAREALSIFWSPDYLEPRGWQGELDFFNTQLRPLIEANYYRDIDRFGRYGDRFWLIDLPFIILFALDIIIRTYRISRHNPRLTWIEAILRRWYDLFLLLPVARWLRIIPLTIRLYQANLLNLEPLRQQLNYDFALSFAEELTELVGIQVIDQMQDYIEQGDLADWLFHSSSHRPYLQLNQHNEAKAIANRLVNVSIRDVLPQIQPDLEALIHYNLAASLQQLPVYRQLQNLPGINNLPTRLTEQLAENLSKTACWGAIHAIEDSEITQLTQRLSDRFFAVLEMELQKKHNLQELETLLVDLLEEIKLNYVRKISEAEMLKIIEEADRLHRLINN